MIKGNCLISQSGGPTAVINNTLYGIIKEAQLADNIEHIYGALYGIQGLLNNQYVKLHNLTKDQLEFLRKTPGAALGTWRYKVTEEDIRRIVLNMKKENIRYFFYIGGNGSMYVANLIHEEAKRCKYELTVIGVPKSIDNDLLHTDHSPGYGSAAKFLATSVLDIHMDARSMANSNRITLLETMGRDAGWLAAACSLTTKVHPNFRTLIYIPEVEFSVERFLTKVQDVYKEDGYCIAVISEGIRDQNNEIINKSTVQKDAVGRPQLGGVTPYLTQLIEDHTHLKARYVFPGIWQRSSMGISSQIDVEEALEVGQYAFHQALSGHSGTMTSIKRLDCIEYKTKYTSIPLAEVAGKERLVPVEWYDPENCQMKKPFETYALPLIQGEAYVEMNSGLPNYQYL